MCNLLKFKNFPISTYPSSVSAKWLETELYSSLVLYLQTLCVQTNLMWCKYGIDQGAVICDETIHSIERVILSDIIIETLGKIDVSFIVYLLSSRFDGERSVVSGRELSATAFVTGARFFVPMSDRSFD